PGAVMAAHVDDDAGAAPEVGAVHDLVAVRALDVEPAPGLGGRRRLGVAGGAAADAEQRGRRGLAALADHVLDGAAVEEDAVAAGALVDEDVADQPRLELGPRLAARARPPPRLTVGVGLGRAIDLGAALVAVLGLVKDAGKAARA